MIDRISTDQTNPLQRRQPRLYPCRITVRLLCLARPGTSVFEASPKAAHSTTRSCIQAPTLRRTSALPSRGSLPLPSILSTARMITCHTMPVLTTKHPSFLSSSQQLTPTGESEGLEFLFDQTNPDRHDRGPHYLTPRRTYRHKRLSQGQGARKLAPRLPTRAVQHEFVKTFFHYVWPVMPVIDAREFLEAFDKDLSTISPLLLWSVFFSALSVSLSLECWLFVDIRSMWTTTYSGGTSSNQEKSSRRNTIRMPR